MLVIPCGMREFDKKGKDRVRMRLLIFGLRDETTEGEKGNVPRFPMNLPALSENVSE